MIDAYLSRVSEVQLLAILRVSYSLIGPRKIVDVFSRESMPSRLFAASQEAPLYRPAKALPIELQEQCAIYLEEGLCMC